MDILLGPADHDRVITLLLILHLPIVIVTKLDITNITSSWDLPIVIGLSHYSQNQQKVSLIAFITKKTLKILQIPMNS